MPEMAQYPGRARRKPASSPRRPPPIGLPLAMGATGPETIANMIGMVTSGLIAPVEMIARR